MSFMGRNGQRLSCFDRSYGLRLRVIHLAIAAVCSAAVIPGTIVPGTAEVPAKVVALGDSLTAGFGLPEKDGFVPRLQAALTAKGVAAEVANAGVSGDTASDGVARLDWSVPQGTEAVILELGANDMLRALDPKVTREALDTIVRRLAARHVAILIAGMRAAPNLGPEYGREFEAIYPDLAAKYGALLYPFFLDGVAGNRTLLQADGLHPNAAGVNVIVERILPKVEELIVRARKERAS